MADEASHRMTLELVAGGDPIGGRLRDAEGLEWPFSGWLGLIAAIDLARAAHSALAEAPASPPAQGRAGGARP